METSTIIVLAGIVLAFTIFAGVLAYGERATRNLPRVRNVAESQAQTPIVGDERKAA